MTDSLVSFFPFDSGNYTAHVRSVAVSYKLGNIQYYTRTYFRKLKKVYFSVIFFRV